MRILLRMLNPRLWIPQCIFCKRFGLIWDGALNYYYCTLFHGVSDRKNLPVLASGVSCFRVLVMKRSQLGEIEKGCSVQSCKLNFIKMFHVTRGEKKYITADWFSPKARQFSVLLCAKPQETCHVINKNKKTKKGRYVPGKGVTA